MTPSPGAAGKVSLRADARARRAATTAAWRVSAATQICGHVSELLGRPDGRSLMSYLAFGDELDLTPLHDAWMADGGRLYVPRVNHRVIDAVEFVPGGELVTSRFGIREPMGKAVDAQLLDVVLVPAVCFDRRGHRIGYGAGYYDRFLPLTRSDVTHIGVAFALQLVERVPEEPHDQPVGAVVTEQEVVVVAGS